MLIYSILNNLNGKRYIGQSVNKFNIRYSGGKWWLKTHNSYLKRSVEKHGLTNFTVEILEENIKTIEELNEREVYFIKLYNSLHPNGYNFTTGGWGHWKHCDEYCDTISKFHHKDKVKLQSPWGEIFEIQNIAKFCRDHRLSPGCVGTVLKGKSEHTQGWCLPDKPRKSIVEKILQFCEMEKMNISQFLDATLTIPGKEGQDCHFRMLEVIKHDEKLSQMLAAEIR